MLRQLREAVNIQYIPLLSIFDVDNAAVELKNMRKVPPNDDDQVLAMSRHYCHVTPLDYSKIIKSSSQLPADALSGTMSSQLLGFSPFSCSLVL